VLTAKTPWTNVVGLARSALALSTLVTLVCNRTSTLFRPLAGVPAWPICGGLRKFDAFCVLPSSHLEWARWFCVAGLLVVASGWRPRLTGIIHWWITFSLQASAATIDGGDQIAAILTFILIPVTLTDDRTWHWVARHARDETRESYKQTTARVALTVARLQMAGIYFHAAIGKLYASQWQDGTALYYWFLNPEFGAPGWLRVFLRPIVLSGLGVTCMTWAVIAVELALVAGLVASRRHWPKLLVLGVTLHLGILVAHGLVSFGIAMIGGLLLYLRPVDSPFHLTASSLALGTRRAAFARHALEP
jgi:antimicrobial peptide system SdpB family protein